MCSLSSVTARFGPASGAHHRDTKGHQHVPESRGFPGAQDDADLRKCNPKGAQDLNEIAIREREPRMESAGCGPNSRQTHRKLRAPAFLQEIFEMFGQSDHFRSPFSKSQQGSYTNSPKSSRIRAF